MLLRLSAQLETAFSAWHQTQGDAADALRRIAGAEANLGRYAPGSLLAFYCRLLQSVAIRASGADNGHGLPIVAQGVSQPVAVAAQKGVGVALGTGWQRRRGELNRLLRLLRLLYASRSSAQHRDSRRRFVSKCCATSAQDKNDGGQRYAPCRKLPILAFVHSRPGVAEAVSGWLPGTTKSGPAP
jgi:hypothetical protein